MKWLEVDTEIRSYVRPLLKIPLFIALIVAAIYRDRLFNISNQTVDIIVTVIATLILIVCWLGIYISIGEIMYAHENRQMDSLKQCRIETSLCVQKTKEEIIALVEDNDIIELVAVIGKDCVELGSASDSKPSSSKFFDKKYYIDKTEYENIEEFANVLKGLSKEDTVYVYSIDGVRLKKQSRNKNKGR